jgi:hypothetical protein
VVRLQLYSHGDVDNGSSWELDVAPMIGGVFERTNGIAPAWR